MDEVLATALAPQRFALVLLAVFAAIALTLALVGIYGVLAYAVSRRTSEIGIRIALGADRGSVVRMVVRQGMTMALIGVGLGILAALGLTRFMQGMLYDVPAQDLATFALVPLVFAAVAVVACWIPAARAARVQPTEALRIE
jgi:ABC-type antimicrobial peptide transport system permease subunit